MSRLVINRCAACGGITSKVYSSYENVKETWVVEAVSNEVCYRCRHVPISPPPADSSVSYRLRDPEPLPRAV